MNNRVIIFSAPSGSGKTTIVQHLLAVDKRLAFSVSACTRPKRAHEVDGRDYYFLSVDEFRRRIAAGDFLEYEEVYNGNYYGTLRAEVERLAAQDKVVLFDVDVVGGLSIKKEFGDDALAVFVKPPGIEVLKSRLRNRSTESEETLKIRIDKAVHELDFENRFDKVLVNDALEKTLPEAEKLVNDFIARNPRQHP
jgi:guanylate kinase